MDPIKQTLRIEGTPEAVYAAVTTQAGFEGWWSKNCTVETEVGKVSEFRFIKDGNPVNMSFRIDSLEQNKKVEWTCTENGNPIWPGTRLTWEIAPEGDAVQLQFVHDGFKQGGPPYEMTAEGWQHFMSSLKSYIEKGEGQPWS